ncbi:rhamnan synthesis F family protein [Rhizobium puerariae]|uniref:Rhamnan synthesis F family protein n=1 Tax=Rhizobium puerariae TaxID=1585791 RepID=A0ABV6ATS0_9HYPH
MNRLGIAFFYDEKGIVDGYMVHLLSKMKEHCSKILLVSNGEIDAESRKQVEQAGCEIFVRENTGFDVGAYKAAIEKIGYREIAKYDELILFNHTFYGPIYPLSEMFDKMDGREVSFWGITSHKEMVPNPFTGEGRLPRHINSHFIAVRKSLLQSNEFVSYWQDMPVITNYFESILRHESKFTEHFSKLGFPFAVYCDDLDYDSHYPSFINIDQTIEDRCPILKRRPFFHPYTFHEEYGIDLPRALRIIKEKTGYDVALIWKNIVRSADLRTLNTNAALMSILPDVRIANTERVYGNIAVCAHIYYTDMTSDLLALAENISGNFDFIATTDSEAKADEIRTVLADCPKIRNVIVRVLEKNRGRDMSALFIACRDLFLDDRYDLVCRMHSKKSPQVDSSRSLLFKRHMEENLLNSRGYVENVLDMFAEQPWVGLAIPPIVHISYPTLGNSWFANRPRAEKIAKMLSISVKFDDDTPVAAYGTMFWFRPKALRKLFAHNWSWEDFNAEPHHVDGGLAHVLERLIAYAAQDAGYTTQHIMSAAQAERNYVSLEYKLQKLSSILGGDFNWQYSLLRRLHASGSLLDHTAESNRANGDGWKSEWWHDHATGAIAVGDANANHIISAQTVQSGGAIPRTTKINWRGLGKARKNSSRLLGSLEHDGKIIADFLKEASGGHDIVGGSEGLLRQAWIYLLSDMNNRRELLFLFDSEYYLASNPDVANSGINPLMHFITEGAGERRNPHPLFNVEFYLNNYPDVERAGINPLLHFIRFGGMELRETHPLFDAKYYSVLYPEVMAAGLSPLHHYVRYGGKERRNPHPLFDTQYYMQQRRSKGVETIGNPLIDYVTLGANSGADPHPLFDERYYRQMHSNAIREENALVDFIMRGASALQTPHPLFDPKFYIEQQVEGCHEIANPLVHYLQNRDMQRHQPHPRFDAAFYLQRYKEVAAANVDPLIHYVRWGVSEIRDPNPDYDASTRQTEWQASGNAFVELIRKETETNRKDAPAHQTEAVGKLS